MKDRFDALNPYIQLMIVIISIHVWMEGAAAWIRLFSRL